MLPLRPLARAAPAASSTTARRALLKQQGAVAGAVTAPAAGGGARAVVPRRGLMMAAADGGGGDKVVVAEDFKAFADETTKAERAIAYFTATWCPPCRTISPVYASLSTKHPEIAFVKIDVDANEEAASKSNIRTIPAFYFYRKGKLVGKLVGADQKKLVEQTEDLEATP